MSIFRRAGSRTRQPQYPAPVSRATALGGAITNAWNAAAGIIDVAGKCPTTGTGITSATNAGLRGFSFDGASSRIVTTLRSSGAVSKFTCIALVKPNGTSGTRDIICFGAGTAYSFQVRQEGAHYDYYLYDGVTDRLCRDTNGVSAGALQLVAITYDAATQQMRIYRDGVLRATTTVSGSPPRAVSTAVLGSEMTAIQFWAGDIYAAWYAPEFVAGDARMAQIVPRLWGLLPPPARRRLWVAPADAARHVLAAAAGAQANAAGSGAVAQHHRPAPAPGVQANAASSATVAQHHRLTGAASTQPNASSVGAISGRTVLAGAPGAQASGASAGAVKQHHRIIAAASVQDSVAAASAVVQHHVLHGAAATQGNTGSAGAVRVPIAGAGATAAEIWAYVLPSGKTAMQTLVETQQMVADLYRIHGLIPGEPLVVGPSSRVAGALVQSIAESAGVVTVQRSS